MAIQPQLQWPNRGILPPLDQSAVDPKDADAAFSNRGLHLDLGTVGPRFRVYSGNLVDCHDTMRQALSCLT